eukprot:TRINITY_DN10760_c0_g2_i1.p1 TRINITY_DN10760_c0_g2~~TRINITY_DN10760_c0_g2_i1.p1  ORF type:complete len:687 (+),score=58.66 TRINITY_DN10760_c0_g2_i1:57-2063(+)
MGVFLSSTLKHAWGRIRGFPSTRLERGMDRLTLKFQVQGAENGFTSSRAESLARGAIRGGVGVCSACLVCFAINAFWLVGAANSGATEEAMFVVRFANFIYIGNIAISLILVCSMRSQHVLRCTSHYMRESIITLWISMMMASLVLVNDYYCALILGMDPEAVFSEGTVFVDTALLLGIVALLIVTHVTLPIRWIVLWPAELVGILSYILPAFVLGSHLAFQAPYHATVLVILTVYLCRGKRAVEFNERILFSVFVEEKSLRYKVEFELSQKSVELSNQTNGKDVDSHGDEAKSMTISLPSTTASGEAFQNCDLDEIRSIGLAEQWLISSSDLHVMHGRVLGQGQFGLVVEGVYQGVPVALKTSNSRMTRRFSPKEANSIYNELRIMRRLRCPNIALFYGACLNVEEGSSVLVLELVDGGTLDKFTHSVSGVCDLDRAHVLCDVAQALLYLHTRQPCIVHGDMKDRNIMAQSWRGHSMVKSEATRRFRAKLIDFGLSRLVTRSARPLGGTLSWVAPEIVRTPGMAPNSAADVFSFGRLAFFVISRICPFEGLALSQVRSVLKSAATLPPLPWKPQNGLLVRNFQSLVERCSSVVPSARPKIQEVKDIIDRVPGKIVGEQIDKMSPESVDIVTRIHHSIGDTDCSQGPSTEDCHVQGDDLEDGARRFQL